MIRVRVTAPGGLKAELEAAVAAAPGLTLADARPDVVLTSLARDDLAGQGAGPAPLVLIGQAEWSAELFRLGVRAILPPDASTAEIVAAVEAAAAGLAAIESAELESLLGESPAGSTSGPDPLTARELEVLRMLAEGAANKTIAWQLKISEHTVKFHVAQILAKLGAGTRTEAVTTGIRRGLIMV
ncbi:MAG TPA: response regulator transcription factor [Candidatus Acidoferrales bacterium]|nr:response regulator transcription factor [Candidatus Acidoferrales bacterium]